MSTETTTDLKYEQLAQELETAIREGRLAVGSRLQSVRKVMDVRGLSLATVLSAYRRLEERGLVAARPKSGYFVVSRGSLRSAARRTATEEPNVSSPSTPTLAPGTSFPHESLLPYERLHRLTASMVRRHPDFAIRRPDARGLGKLREEIARRSAEVGNFVRPAEVLVTNGATEGLSLAIRSVARPGDSVAVQAPVNPRILALLDSLHVRVVEFDTPVGDGGIQKLEEALRQYPDLRALIVVPNFHNPTGALMPVPAKRALVDLAEVRGLAVIELDIYGELQHEGTRPPPLRSYDSSGSVIYLNSYTNSIAPGLHVGWLSGGRWHAQIEASKRDAAISTPELPQWVLLEFLSLGSHIPHYRRLRQQLREHTLRVESELREAVSDRCHWSTPAGGYFLWLEFPSSVDTAEVLARARLALPGVLPGRCFSSRGAFAHCVCINTSLIQSGSIAALASALGRT